MFRHAATPALELGSRTQLPPVLEICLVTQSPPALEICLVTPSPPALEVCSAYSHSQHWRYRFRHTATPSTGDTGSDTQPPPVLEIQVHAPIHPPAMEIQVQAPSHPQHWRYMFRHPATPALKICSGTQPCPSTGDTGSGSVQFMHRLI